MTCGGSYDRAQACADDRAGCGACDSILIDCLLRGQSDLLSCPLPADSVISLKLIKGLSSARHHLNGRALRYGCTSAHYEDHQ
jgi:hypothetical protein